MSAPLRCSRAFGVLRTLPLLAALLPALGATGCSTTCPPAAPGGSAPAVLETDRLAEAVDAAIRIAGRVGPEKVPVVFDLDNTLLSMTTELGSDQWFGWQVEKIDARAETRVADDLDGLLEAQRLIRHLGRMQLTEARAPELLRALQEKGIAVIALTSRGPEEWPDTARSLARFRL